MKLKPVTDKDLIVFLSIKGFDIKDIKTEKGRNRSIVYFELREKLEKAILSFVNKTEKINIGDYQAAERRVKTLLCLHKNK